MSDDNPGKRPAPTSPSLASSPSPAAAATASKKLMQKANVYDFLDLVRNGRLEECKAMIAGCSDAEERKRLLNTGRESGWTILHIAAFFNYPKLIDWILSTEEDGGRTAGFESLLVRQERTQATPLSIAVMCSNLDCCRAIIGGCLTEAERHELLNAESDNGKTALHVAAHTDSPAVVRWLLDNNDNSSNEGGSQSKRASIGGRAAGFQGLLTRLKVTQATALHVAAEYGILENCKALIEGCLNDIERRELLNAVDKDGKTVLHVAASDERPQIIEWLLSREIRAAGFSSLTAINKNGETALHLAASLHRRDCVHALLTGCLSETTTTTTTTTPREREQLLNIVDQSVCTALHTAARFCRANVITELLSWPETVAIGNAVDKSGLTPLHRAVLATTDPQLTRLWGTRESTRKMAERRVDAVAAFTIIVQNHVLVDVNAQSTRAI